MITGYHSLVYSDDPDATRAFLRDVLGWGHVDAGGGWLIFKTPPSEVGIHPSGGPDGQVWGTPPHHQVSLMCDDIDATLADLRAKGVEVGDGITEEDYGRVSSVVVPGAGEMMLYQPLHPLAYELP
jgi:catechol 2,3-dioxygenase-like lactoylglutathione lyase family enzyme